MQETNTRGTDGLHVLIAYPPNLPTWLWVHAASALDFWWEPQAARALVTPSQSPASACLHVSILPKVVLPGRGGFPKRDPAMAIGGCES